VSLLNKYNQMIEKIDNLIHQKKIEKYLNKQYFGYFIIGCFVLLGLFLNWSIKELAVVSFLVWLFLFPLRSQILAKISVICLVMTPLMLFSNYKQRAEAFAELAYLFLALTVVMSISEYLSKEKE